MSSAPIIDCCCDDADFCYENGSFEVTPAIRDDPVLMGKVEATFGIMNRLCKKCAIPKLLSRLEHHGKTYKLHVCCTPV